MPTPLPVAVFASGAGTTFEGLVRLAREGQLPVEFVLVVADRPTAGVLPRAERLGVPSLLFPSKGQDRDRWSEAATRALTSRGARVIVLAGFLSILSPTFLTAWSGRIVNVHPSLLPRHGGPGMYGPRVHEAVLRSGETETGVTVHLVTEAVDGGPVLWQERVPVPPGSTPESLRRLLHPVEVRGLAEVLRKFAADPSART